MTDNNSMENFLGIGKVARNRRKAKIEDRKADSQVKRAQPAVIASVAISPLPTSAQEGPSVQSTKNKVHIWIGAGILVFIILMGVTFFIIKGPKK